METIYKYPLEITDRQLIRLPKYFEILCIKNQNQEPVMYCQVDKEQDAFIDEEIFCFGTGHDITDEIHLRYLDTVIIGNFVWHFYINDL